MEKSIKLLPLRAESLRKRNSFSPTVKNGVKRYLIARKYGWNCVKKRPSKMNGNAVWCYIHSDKLVFRADTFHFNIINKKWENSSKIFVLKIKDGKINCYISNKGILGSKEPLKWINCNIKQQFTQMFNWIKMKKTTEKRIHLIFKTFFKRHKLKFNVSISPSFLPDVEKCIIRNTYPLVRDFKFNVALDARYTKYLRQNSVKKLIRYCFGNHGKILTKAVINGLQTSPTPSGILTNGLVLKGLLPIDYLQKLFQKDIIFRVVNVERAKDIRSFLSLFPPQKIYKWVDSQYLNQMFADTAKMYLEYKDRIQNIPIDGTIQQIHDYISKELRKVRDPNFIFEYSKKQQKIHGLVVDNLRIELPIDRDTLVDYGQIMKNCVGSYSYYIQSGQGLILGVIKDGQLTYNVEIEKDGVVNQFYAARNQPANKEDIEKVLNALNKLEIWPVELEYKGQETIIRNNILNPNAQVAIHIDADQDVLVAQPF
jgi:hypothetical protein